MPGPPCSTMTGWPPPRSTTNSRVSSIATSSPPGASGARRAPRVVALDPEARILQLVGAIDREEQRRERLGDPGLRELPAVHPSQVRDVRDERTHRGLRPGVAP